MSDREIELLRRGFEAWSAGDLAAAEEFLHQDFELRDTVLVEGFVHHGRGAFRSDLERMGEAFDEITYEALEFLDAGETVAVRMRATGRGKGSGAPVMIDFGHVWRFEAGLARTCVVYPSWERAQDAMREEA